MEENEKEKKNEIEIEKENKKETENIRFNFEWKATGFSEVAPNVIATAEKLLELNLVRVEPDLNPDGNVVISHTGLCRTDGMVDMLNKGIVNNNIYTCTYSARLDTGLTELCLSRTEKNTKNVVCRMPACPIKVAGYIYYLRHKAIQENQDVMFGFDAYERNLTRLKIMNLAPKVENFMSQLAIPNIKGLKCAFIGNEGTNKQETIDKISEYLYSIGKISNRRPINLSLKKDFYLGENVLYVISDIQDYLDSSANFDDFSTAAANERKQNKKNIDRIVSEIYGRYIILDCTELEYKGFCKTNSKLPYIFSDVLEFEDYDDKKIFDIFKKMLPDYLKEKMDKNVEKRVQKYIKENRRYLPFKNSELSYFLAGYVMNKAEIELPSERIENNSIEELFKDLIGMNNIKEQLREFNSFLNLRKEIEKYGKKMPDFNLHMMFLGNAGTGKTTVARLVSKILYDMGYIKENKCVEVEAKDLVAAYTGQTPIKTGRVINSALGGVLFIDEAYSLVQTTGNAGTEVINTLIKAMEDYKGDLVVIFAGYTKEMREFIRSNSGIESRIGYTFEFADYTEDELYDIYKMKAEKIGFSINENAESKIREIIDFGKSRKNFGNGRYIDKILQKTLTKHADLNLDKEELFLLNENSIPTMEELLASSSGERKPDEVEKLFNEIIGMEKIKKEVISLGKYAQFRNKLAKISEKSLPDLRLHMVFTGDSGTGKTTMARKITEMLYNIGCIRVNKLVEVDRKDLVGEHIGQTAPKTEKVIESAIGGVLFIDEAYSLTNSDSGNDYGQEVIATLIKAMEDYRDDLVVIFAGYTQEMKKFMNSNSGIASRIGYNFEFENYKADELFAIFKLKCDQYALEFSEEVKNKVMEVFKYFSSVENFGNGRFVDKLLQEMLIKHSSNNDLENNLNVLLVEDVPTIEEMVEITFNNEQAALPSDVSDEDRRWTAIHEIGHALVEYLHNGETTLKIINVIPEGNGYLGYVLHTKPKQKMHYTKRDYLNRIDVSLAGRAAEECILGKVASGCQSDLDKASRLLNDMFNEYGMSDTLGLISTRNNKIGLEMQQNMDKEKKATLEMCYNETKKMLEENRHLFDKVLNVLLEKGSLSGEEFVELIKN